MPTALVVAALVVLNIVLGTRQELKARASVDALARMQIPQARVIRDGTLTQLDATGNSCPATSSRSRPATSSRPTADCCARPPSRPRRRR